MEIELNFPGQRRVPQLVVNIYKDWKWSENVSTQIKNESREILVY